MHQDLLRKLSLLTIRSSMKGKFATIQLAEKHGITGMQAYSLCLLDPGKPVPMRSLSQFVSCDPSNITPIVEQLVNVGMVERREAEHDRRVKMVTLTKKGEQFRTMFLDAIAESRLPYADQLSEEEIRQLTAILDKAADTSLVE